MVCGIGTRKVWRPLCALLWCPLGRSHRRLVDGSNRTTRQSKGRTSNRSAGSLLSRCNWNVCFCPQRSGILSADRSLPTLLARRVRHRVPDELSPTKRFRREIFFACSGLLSGLAALSRPSWILWPFCLVALLAIHPSGRDYSVGASSCLQ